eukprot:c15439_g1_i1.p1 GENE.c15439_g1_i1~~c15439_g1_i1.p1  ORF type:complete len:700 (-),score=179.60 c15439_g1_i1:132-2231(-)
MEARDRSPSGSRVKGKVQEYLRNLEAEKKRVLAVDVESEATANPDSRLTGLVVAENQTNNPKATKTPDPSRYVIENGDENAFRAALFTAAGSPKDEGVAFDKSNMKTWTKLNLKALANGDLSELRALAGHECKTPKPQAKELIVILPVDLFAIVTESEGSRFFAQDKFDLTHSDGKLVSFDLDLKVFDAPTLLNPDDKLKTLLSILLSTGETRTESEFLVLDVSPTHAVTLPPNARAVASIPLSAAYYSFCYPIPIPPHSFDEIHSQGIDTIDPFVSWLTTGAFVYFNHTYDIVAINALSFEESKSSSFLYLGAPSPLPDLSAAQLTATNRFRKVTVKSLEERSYTHFAWIVPSEMVGRHIFTQSGGFAYRNENSKEALFFPVVPPRLLTPRLPTEYNEPVHIPELLHAQQDVVNTADSKWSADISRMNFGESTLAALGIEKLLGINFDTMLSFLKRQTEAIVEEIERNGSDEDKQNLHYILYEKARAEEVVGNDGSRVWRDQNNEGRTIDDFTSMPQARTAELYQCEVLALRLYTSSTFRIINNSLRKRAGQPDVSSWAADPHPLAATTFFIYTALKKLRAVSLSRETFETVYLWRGNKDKGVDPMFMSRGGAELGCMSTSTNLRVVARYARSANPLVFKIKVESPMDYGAEIKWLSLFVEEEEILYPPLTFLKPVRMQPIKGLDSGLLITVKPSFPS